MLESVGGIAIHGKVFAQKTQLFLYPKPSDRVAIVIGRNGSGKSTIAEAFRMIHSPDASSAISAELVDHSGRAITCPATNTEQNWKDVISVYDERYIVSTVKLSPDAKGLKTIVLFSDMVSIDNLIQQKTLDVESEKHNAETLANQMDLFSDFSNPASPLYTWNLIKAELRRDWAIQDKDIKGNKINTPVTDQVAHEIADMKPLHSISDTLARIQEAKNELSTLENFENTGLPPPVMLPAIRDFSEQHLLAILNKTVHRPSLSDREQRILEIGERVGIKHIELIGSTFSKNETTYCPFCFRDIGEEEKENLVKGVERVLNREVDDFRKKLSGLTFPTIRTDWSEYALLNQTLVSTIEKKARQCETIIEQYKTDVINRQDNLFTSIQFKNRQFTEHLQALETSLQNLEEIRNNISNISKHIKQIKNELIELNKEMAHHRIRKLYSTYSAQQIEQTRLNQAKQASLVRIEAINSEIDDLVAKKRGTRIAVAEINKLLGLVFMSTERIQVVLQDDCYYLMINGKNIKPSEVSTGERNVLALCYFFIDIMCNRAVDDFYREERLVVIDDPVSSFDQDNKIGVYSLLLQEISKCLSRNKNSKLVVMTHDLSTYFAMKQPLSDIAKRVGKTAPATVHSWKLLPQANGLVEVKNDLDEYGMLIEDVFAFAQSKEQSSSITIGNEMRRILEAYSSFMYKSGPSDLAANSTVATKLNELAPYFKARMDRILLNDESHTANRIHALSHDGWAFYRISDDEKRNTAKAVLTLLFILDEQHLLSHLDLQKHPNAKQTILQWYQEIKCASTGMVPAEATS